MSDDKNLKDLIREHYRQLPKVVQKAIASSDITKHLRDLAGTQKLHLDQWDALEHEVMLTLLGIQPIEELEKNIASEVEVTSEVAHELAENINKIVFEPVRQELERQLEHPEAQEKQYTGVEAARNQALADAKSDAGHTSSPAGEVRDPASAPSASGLATEPRSVSPAVQPATPPAPVPEVKVARPDDGSNYVPGVTSAQRATVHDDPYREPPV